MEEAMDTRSLNVENLDECIVCSTPQFLYPLECPHKFCLQCIKGCCVTSGACPYCRNVFTDTFRDKIMYNPALLRDVQDSIDEQIRAIFRSYPEGVWVYEGRAHGYWLFTEDIQREIRTCLAADVTTLDTVLCGQIVTLDLIQKFQKNTNTGAMRRMHCLTTLIDEPIKGIAGMACSLRSH